MSNKEESVELERLVAEIPVHLKRRMAAAAALRGMPLKDLVIQVFEEWLAQQDREQGKVA